jgi:hypothetical protein
MLDVHPLSSAPEPPNLHKFKQNLLTRLLSKYILPNKYTNSKGGGGVQMIMCEDEMRRSGLMPMGER